MSDITKPHYDVVITTPGHSMSQMYVLSLASTIKELERNKISWGYFSQYSSDVSAAREATILGGTNVKNEWMYKEPFHGNITYKKIFLIDSDIEWESKDFMKLYYSDKEAITGVYLQGDGQRTTVSEVNPEIIHKVPPQLSKEDILKRTEIFPATGAGLGFACIKSGVFEKIPRPWFAHMVQEMPNMQGGSFLSTFSEDISFILKMKDYGTQLWCDPTVLVNHMKTVRVGWK